MGHVAACANIRINYTVVFMRYKTQLAANIRAEMARRGLNQGDVAKLLASTRSDERFTQPQVSKRIQGHQDWAYGELLTLAQSWGIAVSVLTAGTEDHPFDSNGAVEAVTPA